jgi:hypothetical protein
MVFVVGGGDGDSREVRGCRRVYNVLLAKERAGKWHDDGTTGNHKIDKKGQHRRFMDCKGDASTIYSAAPPVTGSKRRPPVASRAPDGSLLLQTEFQRPWPSTMLVPSVWMSTEIPTRLALKCSLVPRSYRHHRKHGTVLRRSG